MTSSAIDRMNRQIVERRGWRSGTSLENRAIAILSVTFGPTELCQQYRVGNYRLDLAAPDVKMAIEIDGWYHRSPEGSAEDAHRDSWLRSQGWWPLRVDDRHGEESLREQLAWVARIILAERARCGIARGIDLNEWHRKQRRRCRDLAVQR